MKLTGIWAQAMPDFHKCCSCGSDHLGPDCGLTFRQRLLSVRLGPGTMDTRTSKSYYDTDLLTHQFGGKDAKTREAEYMDDTQGFGAATTQPNGDVIAQDPKTKEPRKLTPTEVERIYLGGRD